MQDVGLPNGFLRISDAVERLANGMWGGLRRPVVVRQIKKHQRKLSVGFGLWREQAAITLRTASIEDGLAVYIIAELRAQSDDGLHCPHAKRRIEQRAVPVNVLERLIPSRGGLPDHPIRPTLWVAGGDQELLTLLIKGCLAVKMVEFNAWYASERKKGKWSSQQSRPKVRGGRPTKQTNALRQAVLAVVHDGKWTGKASITILRDLLASSHQIEIPSDDTLGRLVDQLYLETGEPDLRRRVRKRQAQGSTASASRKTSL